jgi:general secretion pathway protein J
MRNGPGVSSDILRPARQLGLTLVELLVAISVLAFVAILGWRGLDSIVRARIALTGEMEQTRGMQIAFAQLQSDCAHLADVSILPNRPMLAAVQGRLMLVRTVFSDNQPSQLQIITYQLKNDVLTRRESSPTRDLRALDILWLATANDTDTAQAVTLQSDVTSMTMRLWINGGWRAGDYAQIPSTGLAASSTTPAGLEVTMRLRGHDASVQKIFLLGAI